MDRPAVLIAALAMSGCVSTMPPLKTMRNLDLNRDMGRWCIFACIPTLIETEVYNAVET